MSGTRAGCPSHCRCEVDGSLWRVSCVDVGLSVIPSNLSGLTSYLMLQNNHLKHFPSGAMQNLRNLQSLRLDANFIACLPASSFKGLTSLRHLWLDDNVLTEVPVVALAGVPTLQAVTLALNNITHIPDGAFSSLSQLVVLHLHDNQIHSLGQRCFDGLHNLETLNLHSNNIKAIPEYSFVGNPSLETMWVPSISILVSNHVDLSHNLIQSLPSFSSCRKLQNIDLHHNSIHNVHSDTFRQMKDLRSLDLTSNHISSISLEDLQSLTHLKLAGNLELRAQLPLHHHKMNFPVSCLSPSSGPSQMCQSPFVPRFMQLSVRFIFILSVAFNFLVLVSIFLSSASKPPSQHLLGVLFWLRFLSGVSGGTMDVRDGVIMDCFGAFGPSKETEAGSRVTGFLFTLSSQACVFLTMAFVLQHKNLSFDLNLPKAWRNLQVTFAVCCTLALAVTALPLIISLFSPCVSSSHRHSPCWGYNTALVVLNALCYTFTTVTHAFLDCHRVTLKPKGLQDAATTRMTTFLLVTNTVLFLSATLLSFSSLLPLPSLPDTQVDKSTVLLIVTALPACLDPLLYMFFSLHFREDLLHFLQKKLYRLNSGKDTQHASVNSEDADKQSCQSVEIVVSVSL
uniref:G-protein coupled receptors family 1 profile domain-containing protein n=1 Tax=Myripristis murdjan TaxID=586833 RepID=A0A667ZLV6_9TELE